MKRFRPFDPLFLNEIKEKGVVLSTIEQKAAVGIYYEMVADPLLW
jgi:hypothetical protein